MQLPLRSPIATRTDSIKSQGRRSVLIILAVALLTASACFALLFLSPAGRPTLEIRVTSATPGFSQVFFADGEGVFSEERSASQPVRVGENLLVFPLSAWRGRTGEVARWDPLDQPGEMTVQSMALTAFGMSQSVAPDEIQPLSSMGEIRASEAGSELSLQSNDPQALLSVATDGFYRDSLLRAMLWSLLAFVLVVAVLFGALRLSTDDQRSRLAKLVRVQRQGGAGNDREVPVPLPAAVFAALIAAASAILLVVGSQRIGVSWDEPWHKTSFLEFLSSGWFVPRSMFVDGVPDPFAASVYGPVGLFIAYAVSSFAGVDDWAVVPPSAGSFAISHLATAFLALLAILVVATSARIILGSWRWALVSAAILSSVPLFMGHGMFNMIDVAPACGFTLVTLGLVVLWRFASFRFGWALAFVATTTGVVLAVGTRPGIWIALLVSVLTTILLSLATERSTYSFSDALKLCGIRTGTVVASGLTSATALWFIYPAVFADLRSLLGVSLSSSRDFRASGETLTAGVMMPAQPPVSYLPLWLGAQLPIVISFLAVVGVVTLAFWLIRSLKDGEHQPSKLLSGIPVVMQAASVPIGAVILGSTLYGGTRQLLFIFPAIALLGAIGLYALADRARDARRAWVKPALWVAVCLGLLVPLLSQVRLFPYSFAYFNIVAATEEINGNWELDGWWLSARELAEESEVTRRLVCAESPPRPIVDCARLGVIAPYLNQAAEPPSKGHEASYTLFTRFETALTEDACRSVGQVSRPLFWRQVRLSKVEECDLTLQVLPSLGKVFADLDRPDPGILWGWNPYLLWGWGDPESSGAWTSGGQAGIGFTRPSDSARKSDRWSLRLDGLLQVPEGAGRPIPVTVNGYPVGSIEANGSGEPGEYVFTVPREALDALDGRRVVVELGNLDEIPQGSPVGVGLRFRLDAIALDASPG